MGKTVIYLLYKYGVYKGDYTAKQLKDMIGVSENTVYNYAYTGCPYKGYTFQRENYTGKPVSGMKLTELLAEWDKTVSLFRT